MKRLPIATFGVLLLTATSILLPSAIEAKKLKWKPITADQSGIVLNIDGYETKYRGTGWDEQYIQQRFRADVGYREGILRIRMVMQVITPGGVWNRALKDLKSSVRKLSLFKYRIERFIETNGPTAANQNYDTDVRRGAAKYALNHHNFKFCYYFRAVPHFGVTADFNPAFRLEICAKEDLNLSIKNPEKFFIIDDRNEKVRLDLSYQNLGQKIAALKNPTLSTSSDSVVAADAETYFYKFGNRHSCSTTYIPGNTSKQVCEMALNSSKTDWQKGVYPFELPCYIAEAKKRFPNSPLKECQRLVDASVPKKSEITSDGNGNIADRLKALKKLEDAGLISKEEAAAKRKEILKNL